MEAGVEQEITGKTGKRVRQRGM